jgi:hypothetical protein
LARTQWLERLQEQSMLDAIVIGLAAVFFIATIAYAYACDRL